MPNYKLTRDLIADCTALIPQNLELLNENNLTIDSIYFLFKNDCIEKFDKSKGYTGCVARVDLVDYSDFYQFQILSHCLRTIPEFQKQNPKANSFYYFTQPQPATNTPNGVAYSLLENRIKEYIPKTIASATLHGKGEYPPATLEELCESYKNVMSK